MILDNIPREKCPFCRRTLTSITKPSYKEFGEEMETYCEHCSAEEKIKFFNLTYNAGVWHPRYVYFSTDSIITTVYLHITNYQVCANNNNDDYLIYDVYAFLWKPALKLHYDICPLDFSKPQDILKKIEMYLTFK